MNTLAWQVLKLFSDMQRDELDLHILFESVGNDPEGRVRVLNAIDDLLREGLLEIAGNDFYRITYKGKNATAPV